MVEHKIDKGQAAVLVENAHDLWIQAKNFTLTHETIRLRKQKWFTGLARTTLAASIVTVGLSGFGLSQDPAATSNSIDGSGTPPSPQSSGQTPTEPDARPNRLVWFLTTFSATLAAVAKLGEQHIGRPEDIQSHMHAEWLLSRKMDSLKLLVARIMGYHDGIHTHDIHELSNQYQALAVEVGDAGRLVGVTPDRSKESEARYAILGTQIDIALSRVRTPDELPDNAAGIQLAVRGGEV